MKKHKLKVKVYLRLCKRCSKYYRTEAKQSRICINCYKTNNPKKNG